MKDRINCILDWLILTYVFLIPWQAVYIFDEQLINGTKSQFLTGQLYASELILGLIAIIWLINNFSLRKISDLLKNFNLSRTQNLFIIFLWIFIAYSGLSILWSGYQSAGYYLWLHLLEAGALMLLILNSKLNRFKILWAIIISAGLQGLLAIGQFLSQDIGANKWLGIAGHSAGTLGDIVIETTDGRWLRAYGSFGHPNILAGFLMLGIIAGLLLWLESQKSRAKQLIILISCLIISAGIFFTFSRSAWLSLIIFLPIIIYSGLKKFQEKERRRFVTLITGIILTFLTFSYLFFPLIAVRSSNASRLEAISTGDRLSQITQASEIISQNIFFGVGINNYTVELAKIYPDLTAYELQPVHNSYLMIMAELGLTGMALALIIFWSVSKFSQNTLKSLIFLAPIASILIISIFDHYFWTQYSGLIMASIALTIWLKCTKIDNHDL